MLSLGWVHQLSTLTDTGTRDLNQHEKSSTRYKHATEFRTMVVDTNNHPLSKVCSFRTHDDDEVDDGPNRADYARSPPGGAA